MSADPRAHAAAVELILEAHVGADRVFAWGEVPGLDDNPGETPPLCVLLQVARANRPALQMGRTSGRTSWRIAARAVGRNADECRWVLDRISQALSGTRVPVGPDASTPVQFESADDAGPDDGCMSALTTWTYST